MARDFETAITLPQQSLDVDALDINGATELTAVDQTADLIPIYDADGSVVKKVKPDSLSRLTTKGDLLTYGTAPSRLGVGSDGQVLTADSAQSSGLKWADAGGGGGDAISPLQATTLDLLVTPGLPNTPASLTTTQNLSTTGLVLAVPIFVLGSVDVEFLSFSVASGSAGTNAEIALYVADGSSGSPGTKVTASGNISCAGAGIKTFTTGGVAATRGWHWLMLQCDSSAPTFDAVSASDADIRTMGALVPSQNTNGTLTISSYSYAGSWPADASSWTWYQPQGENTIWMRAKSGTGQSY